MKLDTFFEKFDEFVEAPNAVQKMRELILWSAFCGAFSPVDRDQPLPKAFIGEGAQKLPSIPSSWTWSQGRDIYQVIRGVSYKKDDALEKPADDSCPLLRANNINVALNFEDLIYIPRRLVRDDQFICRGDIVIAMSSGSKKLVGKAAQVVTDFKGTFGAFCGVIRNTSKISNNFLARYFKSPQYTLWVTSAGRGIGINNLGKSDLDTLPIPTPPLAEQKRIVAKVDELMALCDRLEAQEAERKEKKRRLSRAAIARFTEKPTVGNLGLVFHKAYDVEPAEIRKVILELAVRGKLLPNNGPKWPVKFLKSVTTKIGSGATPSGGKANYKTKGIPLIRSMNVYYESFDRTGLAYLDTEQAKKLDNVIVQTDDVLLNITGASIGRVSIAPHDMNGARVNQHVSIVRPTSELVPDFLAMFLASPSMQTLIMDIQVGATREALTKSMIEQFTIPLPPLVEQNRIVAKVDELMGLVDALEAELAESRALSERLLDAAIATVIENAQREGARQVLPQTRVANEELREAFLISRIVSKTADSEHPLGRFRRTKFSYLAHRRAGDDVTKHYIKKAAGPYSPWAKFDGPEDMARARGYVRDTKADSLEGMVAGARVGEVEEQVTDPLIGEAVDWVMKNFHFETNDSLELLTTVDFAAVGLQKEGKEISREAVKNVIASSKDWTAKLTRELFSDENIDKALKRMAGVFQEMYGK